MSVHSEEIHNSHTVRDNKSELTSMDRNYIQSSEYISDSQWNTEYVSTGNDVTVVHKTVQGTELESVSKDNWSPLTELVLSNVLDGDIGEINLDEQHPSCDCEHPSSGYVQSNTSSVVGNATEPQSVLTSNAFELELSLSDELSDVDCNSQSSNCSTHETLMHLRPRLLNTDWQPKGHNDVEGVCLDTSHSSLNNSLINNCIPTQSIDTKLECGRAKIDNPHSNHPGYICLHPPPTSSQENKSRELKLSVESQSLFLEQLPSTKKEYSHVGSLSNLLPCPSLDESVNGNEDSPCTADASTSGYTPSELFTREIVVPGPVSPSETEPGFTVHLDFDDGPPKQPQVRGHELSESDNTKLDFETSRLTRTQKDDQQLLQCLNGNGACSSKTLYSNRYIISELPVARK